MSDALAAKFGIEVVSAARTPPVARTLAEVGVVCLVAVALYFAFAFRSGRGAGPPSPAPARRRSQR